MTALEQLRQGIGGVKLTSALDLLRQGVIEPPQADIFGMKTTTPAFIPPKPEQPKVSIKDVLREVPGVMGQAREAVRKTLAPTKAEILAEIQEKEQITLTPEEAKRRVLEKIGEEVAFAPNLFAVLTKAKTQTPEEFFAEPLSIRIGLDVGVLSKVGTKIGASFISRMAKETDTKVIKQLAGLAGEVMDDITAGLVSKAKTPTAVKQILDTSAQKIAAKVAPHIVPDLQPLAQEARNAEKVLRRTYLEAIEEGKTPSQIVGLRKAGLQEAQFTETGRGVSGVLSPEERIALFNKTKNEFNQEIAKAKELGFENIKSYNRAQRMLEGEAIPITVENLKGLAPIIKKQAQALKEDNFIALKEVKSQLTDIYNRAVREGGFVEETIISRQGIGKTQLEYPLKTYSDLEPLAQEARNGIQVFHGTTKKFTEFDTLAGEKSSKPISALGTFFTNEPRNAQSIANIKGGGNVMTATIKLNNPKVYPDFTSLIKDAEAEGKLFMTTSKGGGMLERGNIEPVVKLREKLKARGHDGIIISKNTAEGLPDTQYIIFDSKSASLEGIKSTKQFESLAERAKNYKTADEFINSFKKEAVDSFCINI